MSNLLERAIVDAKALKEAALKSAEQLVIDKYSEEVRTAMDKMLEQEDPLAALGGDAEDPLAAMEPTGEDPLACDNPEAPE